MLWERLDERLGVDRSVVADYACPMNITLPADQQKWLEAEVAAGRFESIDDALAAAVAELMLIDADDLAWARPYVEEARASVARGEVIAGEEFFHRLEGRLDRLRSR
jgi:antitoxin ParD1/3/4